MSDEGDIGVVRGMLRLSSQKSSFLSVAFHGDHRKITRFRYVCRLSVLGSLPDLRQ